MSFESPDFGAVSQFRQLVALSDRFDEFRKLDTAVVGISVDSPESLLAWSRTSRREGGLGGPLNFPLVSDLSGEIGEAYGARWLVRSC